VACPGWLYWLGDHVYESTLAINHQVNNIRRRCGLAYLPLLERLKLALPTSARYIARFEQVAARHAAAAGYDGIVCGHIHRANLCRIGDALYCNTGDWVESCSALIEDKAGQLQLQRWPHHLPLPCPATPLVADAA
jgi:UDP-2,3-diacylglucosamine pyrophosphatase LpxH